MLKLVVIGCLVHNPSACERFERLRVPAHICAMAQAQGTFKSEVALNGEWAKARSHIVCEQ